MADVRSVLERALAGRRLSRADAQALFDHGDLLDLAQVAAELRRRRVDPAVATYIIDRNINYTNVCLYRCRFCAFYRGPEDADAYVLPFDQIVLKVAETISSGGTGVLLQGGVHPALDLDYYESLLRRLKQTFPHLHLHAFSSPEIWYVSQREGMDVAEVISRLHEAGLDSIPGGGAEILEDGTRLRIASEARASTEQWLRVHRRAHEQGLRSTATMMIGVGEPTEARVNHLLAIRSLQDETGGFTAFIPWTFQDRNTRLEGQINQAGGYDYLRTLSISRVFLDNIDHVQGSWVTQGAKVGQLSLLFGADDLGSLMLEENVVAAAGVRFRMGQREMERAIRGAGLTPRQRRTLYEPL